MNCLKVTVNGVEAGYGYTVRVDVDAAAVVRFVQVGDIGVVSFGDTVEMLHPLGQPFNADAGACPV